MTLFSRIGMIVGMFLIVAGIIYGTVAALIGPQKEWEGFTLMLTAAGGALLIGTYLTRAVQQAREHLAAQAAGAAAGDTEPHVAPTIWPLIFALSMIGLVFGVESPWALAGGGVLLVVALAGWSLDVRRQWRHHHAASPGTAHGGAHSGAGQ